MSGGENRRKEYLNHDKWLNFYVKLQPVILPKPCSPILYLVWKWKYDSQDQLYSDHPLLAVKVQHQYNQYHCPIVVGGGTATE